MRLLNYFDLGILPPEPVLGKKGKRSEEQRRRELKKLLWTLLMYGGVFLGILAENWLELYNTKSAWEWERVVVAVIIATLTFPQVFPKLFAKQEPDTEDGESPAQWRFVQFCVAFQNGFFWQALVGQISKAFAS